MGSKGVQANFSLSSLGLEPSSDPHSITCTATLAGQEYTDETRLMYLPENPYNGSTVKIDRKTGYLKVQYEAGQAWRTVLPFGFYDVSRPPLKILIEADGLEHQCYRDGEQAADRRRPDSRAGSDDRTRRGQSCLSKTGQRKRWTSR